MRGCLAASVIVAVGVGTGVGAARADVVVAYDRPPPTFGAVPKEVLRRHGQRIRIDSRLAMDRTGVAIFRQVFTRPGQTVSFALTSYEDGRWAYLSVMDDPLTAPPLAGLRRFTGEIETHLGERCRVWRVVRQVGHPPTSQNAFVQSGCVTADGVELWRRQANIDAIFATRVRRERVSAAEVRVPTEALSPARWVTPAEIADSASDHSGDYEVVLEPTATGGPHLTIRRSAHWTAVSETQRSNPTLTLTNIVAGITFSYSRDPSGERRLSIRRRPPGGGSPPDATRARNPLRIGTRPDEVVLGERCTWWNTTPDIQDFERDECRTVDGIALKVSNVSRGDESAAVAVSLVRRAQPLSAVLPASEIVSAGVWGF